MLWLIDKLQRIGLLKQEYCLELIICMAVSVSNFLPNTHIYIFLVDISQEDTLLSVLLLLKWIMPVLSLSNTVT